MSFSSTSMFFLIGQAVQNVQKIGRRWLRPFPGSSSPEVPLILDGMKYIHSNSLFLRRDHRCSYIFPGSVPYYIPYSGLHWLKILGFLTLIQIINFIIVLVPCLAKGGYPTSTWFVAVGSMSTPGGALCRLPAPSVAHFLLSSIYPRHAHHPAFHQDCSKSL